MADDIRDADTDGEPSREDGGAPRRELIELDLWERFLAGHATDSEVASVCAWAASVTGDPAAAEQLRVILRTSDPRGDAPPVVDADIFFAALKTRLALADPVGTSVQRIRQDSTQRSPDQGGIPSITRPSTLPRPWPRGVAGGATWRWVAVAAALVIAVGFSVTVGGVGRHGVGVAGRSHEYATAAGQRLSVTLVDGTQVTLAPASKVRVAADYGRQSSGRAVDLEGEAYFAVTHDAAHPFRVRTHGAVARDVGTAFDVRAYPEDAGARIAVAEGAVAVAMAGACRIGGDACDAQVRAGDVATVGRNEVAVIHRGDVRAYVAWMQGGLVFEDTPLRDAAHALSRAFDLDVSIADSALAARPITATFGDDRVDEVLDAVAQAVGATYERVGRKVMIRQGHRAGRRGVTHTPLATAELGATE